METQNTSLSTGGLWDARPDASKYPNPFCDIASMYIPTNLNDGFEWSEFLYMTMPPFAAVVNRVVSYFLTDVEVNDVSDDTRDKYEDFFDGQRVARVGNQLQGVHGRAFAAEAIDGRVAQNVLHLLFVVVLLVVSLLSLLAATGGQRHCCDENQYFLHIPCL